MIIGVLGATGFVGKNLLQKLTPDNLPHCLGVIPASRRLGIDATNANQLVEWINRNEITHLVNLAAECGGIGLNQRTPADLWISSTKISAAVLEATIACKLTKLIQVGTVCSYSKHSPIPFKESDLMRHGEPESTNLAYGVAKLNSLYGAQAVTKQYGIDICNLIPVNMYGPHDHFELENSHVIPAIITKLEQAKNEPVTMWGTGDATREFLYVDDFAEAILLAITKPTTPAFMNVGTGKEIKIRDLVSLIAGIMGHEGDIRWDINKPDGQPRRCLDVSKIKENLDFEAKTNLTVGLQKTIDWYTNEKNSGRLLSLSST